MLRALRPRGPSSHNAAPTLKKKHVLFLEHGRDLPLAAFFGACSTHLSPVSRVSRLRQAWSVVHYKHLGLLIPMAMTLIIETSRMTL